MMEGILRGKLVGDMILLELIIEGQPPFRQQVPKADRSRWRSLAEKLSRDFGIQPGDVLNTLQQALDESRQASASDGAISAIENQTAECDGKPWERLRVSVGDARRDGRRRVIALEGSEVLHIDVLDPSSDAGRRRFVKRLAERIALENGKVDDLLRWFEAALREAVEQHDVEGLRDEEASSCEIAASVREEASRLLESPGLLGEIVDAAAALGVVGERHLVALTYLVCTSRLLERPLYLVLQGSASSGKTFILERTTQLLPPQVVVSITDATANSLYYLDDPSALLHKVMVLGERKRQMVEESIDATKALRELIETGRLSKLIPLKTGEGLQSIKLELEGAPAILESASHNAIPYEDVTRMIQAWPDESEAQTRRVLQAFAERKARGETGLTEEKLETIRAVQMLLEPRMVLVPFLPELAERFPCTQPEARRVFARWSALIETSALLHQRQRERQGDAIIASEDDAKLTWRLIAPWVKHRLVEGPPPATIKVWESLRNHGEMTQAALAESGIASRPTLRTALRYLERVGAIEMLDQGAGKTKLILVKNPDWQPVEYDPFDIEAERSTHFHVCEAGFQLSTLT